MTAVLMVLIGIIALAAGVGIGFVIRHRVVSTRVQSSETRAENVVREAEREAETLVRQAMSEVKDEIAAVRREAEEDVRTRREEARTREEWLSQKEEVLDRKIADVEKRQAEIEASEADLAEGRKKLEQAAAVHRRELERISQLTAQEAKDLLMKQVVDDAKKQSMATVREIEQRAREEGEERARKIVTIAIQRVASEQTSESTVSVFSLPSEDMKGRIIGREGRN